MELCRLDDLEDGQARGFAVEGLRRKVVLVRRAGRVHAWLDSCPHYSAGIPMAWKTDAYLSGDRKHLACSAHGALFDIATGECVIGPCLGQSLTPVAITITEQGVIELARANLPVEEPA